MGFLQSVADVLEVEKIGIDDAFRQTPAWCSLKAFGLMVMLENDYHAPVKIDAFLTFQTVRDLFRVAFIAFAAERLGVSPCQVNEASGMGTLPGWDSVMHLRLVMEAEKRFGCSYPLETIPSITKIADFVEKSVWK